MIRLDNVEKVYRTDRIETVALSGVNLDIEEGEFVSIMGPSGCGKSTLMHLMGLLDAPSKGTISLQGAAVTDACDKALARLRNESIGFVFQSFHLMPTMSALDNVQLPMFEREWSRNERRERAEALLAAVGVAHRQDKRPAQLSGGERQRVAIARALANEPELLLADEPTGSLDSASAGQVLALLRALLESRGLTLLVVTHDAAVAAHAERTVRMLDGRIVDDRPVTPH